MKKIFTKTVAALLCVTLISISANPLTAFAKEKGLVAIIDGCGGEMFLDFFSRPSGQQYNAVVYYDGDAYPAHFDENGIIKYALGHQYGDCLELFTTGDACNYSCNYNEVLKYDYNDLSICYAYQTAPYGSVFTTLSYLPFKPFDINNLSVFYDNRNIIFNECGQVIADIMYDNNNTISSTSYFTYDELHRMTSFITYYTQNESHYGYTYAYDEDGYLSTIAYIDSSYTTAPEVWLHFIYQK